MKTLAVAAVAAAFGIAGTTQASACASGSLGYGSVGPALTTFPNDPLYPKQWGLRQVHAPDAWALGAQGAGATIAIVDTGVDLGHPDLKANLVPGADLISGDTCGPQDLNGHGTHVAGIAAALANNGVGGAGMAPQAKVMPVRVLDASGAGTADDVIAGIKWAADHGASVINLSIGDDLPQVPISSPVDLSNIAAAVTYAYNHGAVVVAAASNSSLPFCSYPAASADAVCVAATDSSGFPSIYSNFPATNSGGVAVRAPGGSGTGSCSDNDIWSTYWPGAKDDTCGAVGYEPLAGTSMATPFVSGLAALLRGAGLTNAAVMDCLKTTSSNGGNYDPVNGYGEINASTAIQKCAHLPISTTTPGTGGSSTGQSTGPTTPTTGGSQPQQQGSGQVLGEHAASDTTAPRVAVAIPASRKAHAARAGYVSVRIRLNENARVAVKVVNGRETAIAGRNAIVIARSTSSVRSGTALVKVALTRMGKTVLRKHARLTVTVLAVARDAAGNNGTAIAEGKVRR